MRNEASVWFNLRYNRSRWSLNRFTSLSYLRYFLMKGKETIELLFTRACPTWRTKSAVVKRLTLVKPWRDSSWTNASRISRSVFRNRGILDKGYIEIFRHFFSSLLSRFAPFNLITCDADSGGSNSAVTTWCRKRQLRSRAKLRFSRFLLRCFISKTTGACYATRINLLCVRRTYFVSAT